MSYTPHEWIDGETITAAKMNNIEEGIDEAAQSGGGDGFDAKIRYDADEGAHTIEKGTFAEIKGMMDDGGCPKILYTEYSSSGVNDITCICIVCSYVNWYGSRGYLHIEGPYPNNSTLMIGWNEQDEIFYDD